MLEKPDLLPYTRIVDYLRLAYGLAVTHIVFLPLGADRNTAVYRVEADDGRAYFVKLRSGSFDETTVTIPKFLHDQGIEQIIAPLATQTHQLWVNLGEYKLMVSPFVEGRDGYEVALSDQHWVDLGRALKSLHTAALPDTLLNEIPQETFSPQWRDIVKHFQQQIKEATFADPVSAALAAFLKDKHSEINDLVRRAERLAAVLQTRSLPFVVCHADIHAGNVLIDTRGTLYVVDWDTLTRAPRERDLMFVGGGLFANWRSPESEETLFYQGYGQTQVDPVALAYYRYERIAQDIAAYCEEIFLTAPGSADREEGLQQLTDQFLPGGVVEMAYRMEAHLPPELRSA